MIRHVFFALIFFVLPITLSAQNNVITGKVTGPNANALANVSVIIKGTAIGTATGPDGTYKISGTKPSGNILVFTSVGYGDQEIAQKVRLVINVQMVTADQSLNAVVVVGYGTQKRSDISGSVATVKVSNLVSQPTADITAMLRGQVPGLNVSVNDARPGGSSNVLLRGIRSLKGSNSPLYVVDGVPITTSINDLNIDDIESISVLKDASSQAIYGSRASNGVILITTKRGTNTDNKVHVSYQGLVSFQNVHANFSLYSPQQFIQLRREA
ncbi:MAG: TonB-dependent receptor plug domain-containing protein, partial [Bacteroidota bacterium]|nr:TonB-dependent receptor plug domain-containing protein [Bacteroidota bacterium]